MLHQQLDFALLELFDELAAERPGAIGVIMDMHDAADEQAAHLPFGGLQIDGEVGPGTEWKTDAQLQSAERDVLDDASPAHAVADLERPGGRFDIAELPNGLAFVEVGEFGAADGMDHRGTT